VRTPALAALDAPDFTAREREVARLAAGSLSNCGIAERLGIAVRTVGNHLHRAHAKLGVGRRGELAPLLPGPRHDA
jgi:DNA-binding CsgD family transcriptional regulator